MRWGDLADEYLALYPHATDEEAADSVAQNSSDGAFWHMRLFADYQAKRGNKAWLFYFAQNPPSPAGEPPLPATHASEVPYVFNNLGELPLFPDRSVAEARQGFGAGSESGGQDVVVLGQLRAHR